VQNLPLKKTALKKILVCEFITAGGLSDAPLADSLAKEGTMMRDALLRDLSELNQFELVTMHDVRLPASLFAEHSKAVESGAFKKVFKKMLKQVDYVWLIAPETDSILLDLSELCYQAQNLENGAIFLGCGYDATLAGTSKTLTFEALQAANIYTLPVFSGDDFIEQAYFDNMHSLNVQKWVAKPEDGAGCEGIRIFENLQDLHDWLKLDDQYLHYLAQPYQSGLAGSFSMLCTDGKGWLLSCNQQHIACDDVTFKLNGLTVNGLLQYWKRFETIARKIAQMLPDAAGYMGVDVIVDTARDKIYVIEINPRLTTSYVGLREAMGCNPAKIILDCLLNKSFIMPPIAKNQVEVLL
jgi:predicted ATP-grasp superfamily ATP-dependent carboligase